MISAAMEISNEKNFQQKGDCLDKTKQKNCSDKKNKNPGQNEKKKVAQATKQVVFDSLL